MIGFRMETGRINAALLERFENECRKREGINDYVSPNLNDFINEAFSNYMDEYFKEFPIIRHDYLDKPGM